MSYLVLARKWRPQTFEAITGQEHVTRTLTQAIEQDRVHHAFLFCGARGVGKTSAARVLARALNCQSTEGPTGTPCGTCASCQEIAACGSIDVIEIDGASNRGIGEIRELREGVAYAPQRDRFKLYIIDEVHMLTMEAFNALLKTLEEPPAHVKFIFATTEPHRIPVTILSRCQRFDFKRIPLETMATRLGEILKEEKISFDAEAMRLVCRESEGSMRDALSLVDRIIGFCGQQATYGDVAKILGVADRSWLHGFLLAALSHDAPKALGVIRNVFEHGLDLRQFSSDLVHVLRDVIVLGVAQEHSELTDLADGERQSLLKMAHEVQSEDLERLFTIVSRTAERLEHAAFPRLELEMMAIRMCRLQPLRSIDELLERLGAVERALDTGEPLPPTFTPPNEPGPGSAVERGSLDGHGTMPPVASNSEPSEDTMNRPQGVSESLTVVPDAPAAQPPVGEPTVVETSLAVEDYGAASAGPPLMEAEALKLKLVGAPTPVSGSPVEPVVEAVAEAVAEAVPESAQEVLEVFEQSHWDEFVDNLRATHPSIAANLDHGQVVSYVEGTLRVGFVRGGFNIQEVGRNQSQLLDLLNTHQGRVLAFELQELDELANTSFVRREAKKQAQRKAKQDAIAQHPAVQSVLEQFDGKLQAVLLAEDDKENTA